MYTDQAKLDLRTEIEAFILEDIDQEFYCEGIILNFAYNDYFYIENSKELNLTSDDMIRIDERLDEANILAKQILEINNNIDDMVSYLFTRES